MTCEGARQDKESGAMYLKAERDQPWDQKQEGTGQRNRFLCYAITQGRYGGGKKRRGTECRCVKVTA